MFQSLIGRVEISANEIVSMYLAEFQSLIGRVEIKTTLQQDLTVEITFQSLIGRVEMTKTLTNRHTFTSFNLS